jgi:7,8-dihydroneopterin aldolase/epimerase/oxygenase
MALISIENMRFRAHHGLYEEERILGNDFMVDVWVETDINGAEVVYEHETDKLKNSVNYATIHDIVTIVMRQPEHLLETVVQKIILHLKFQFDAMRMVRVQLRKLNPPVSGIVGFAAVTETMSFGRVCPKCDEEFICYQDGTCKCLDIKSKIHERTLELTERQYKGCLCRDCLAELI